MLDFIFIPLVVGTITLGIYKLFELFVRRKERLILIEKIGDKLDASKFLDGSNLADNLSFSENLHIRSHFSTLRVGCLLIGIGLGLLTGFFVALNTVGLFAPNDDAHWQHHETVAVIYGACTLLMGGLGLLTAYLIETKQLHKNRS